MSQTYKRTIPIALTVLIVVVICLKTFTDEPTLVFWGQTFQTWSSWVFTFATFLGAIIFLMYHVPKIAKKAEQPIKHQWIYSISAVAIMLIYTITGVVYSSTSSQYQWLYNTWYGPVSGLLNAVTAFFAISAIYRSFRVRTLESLLLVGPALLILLYDAPIGVTLFPPIGPIAEYIFAYIGPSAFRGFTVAASFGTLIFCIRTAIGWEKGYLGAEGEETRGA